MKEIRIGIIGFGTVGQGLGRTLLQQKQSLLAKTGITYTLQMIAIRSNRPLPIEFEGIATTTNAEDIISSQEIDIVVELIGGMEPAKSFILKAIRNGKHVVTANKALLAVHGQEIFEAAAKAGVEVSFEGSVGGGIPVIKSLKEGLVANRIKSLRGIMNGTANYILSKMTDQGRPFAEVLQEAQELGFAEADPSYDVDGIDTAHKLSILMSIAYGRFVHFNDISVEGISQIKPIDISFAHNFGYRIKLLAISHNHGDHVEARVHPTMVPENHAFASIDGAFSGILFHGDVVGDILLCGQGAGMMPTGSAVAADIVDIGRNIAEKSINRVAPIGWISEPCKPPRITPMDELVCPYYFRITALDQPGVLAAITAIFAEYGISIHSMYQHDDNKETSETVYIVFRTHHAKEAKVKEAIAKIDQLDICPAATVTIRLMIEN